MFRQGASKSGIGREHPGPAGRRADELAPLHRPADQVLVLLEGPERLGIIGVDQQGPGEGTGQLGAPVRQHARPGELAARGQGQRHGRVDVAAAQSPADVDRHRHGQAPRRGDHHLVGRLVQQDIPGDHAVAQQDEQGRPEELTRQRGPERRQCHDTRSSWKPMMRKFAVT